MPRFPSLSVLAAAACLLLAGPAAAMPVYDRDDREDPVEVEDSRTLALADSTAALFESGRVVLRGGRAYLATKSYQESRRLCPGERFAGQRVGASCSGALVGPDLLLTAGHCVTDEQNCKGTAFVFGFRVGADGSTPASVPAGEVYRCAALLGRRLEDGRGSDWALVRLDRAVAGRSPLGLSRGPVAKGTPLLVIGHPDGLPQKVAGNATVLDPSPASYFITDLDTFEGNSGSPVFDARTRLIAGVLVRGEDDFDSVKLPDGSRCFKPKVCLKGDCRGEDVTKASEFALLVAGSRRSGNPLAASSPALESLAQLAAPR